MGSGVVAFPMPRRGEVDVWRYWSDRSMLIDNHIEMKYNLYLYD